MSSAQKDCPVEETALIAARPLNLPVALERCEQEASRGVFDTGRYRAAYYVWGTGPPLLFVHGLGDRAAAFAPVISILAEHFRCIAYDLPSGSGDGVRLSRITHADLVEDAFALLDHLGVTRSYVLGSSFGSTIALAAMHACPERIPRGILAGGFARRQLAWPEILLARLGLYLPGPVRFLPLWRLVGQHNFGPQAKNRPDFLRYFLETTGTALSRSMAHRALIVHQIDLRPILSGIRQPALMICGECDEVVPQRCEEPLLEGLPNVGRVELSGCGHFAHYSHPEVMAEVIRRFLTPPTCPSQRS